MQFDPEDSFAARSGPVDTAPVHRISRRLRGLQPEFGPLATTTPAVMISTASQTVLQTGSTTPFILNPPRTPRSFHGDRFEDAEDWLDGYECVAAFNEWDDQRKLRNVYWSLDDPARTWFENHEASMTSWPEFRRQLLATYSGIDRKVKAELALQVRVQKPNESVAMFVEDMCRR